MTDDKKAALLPCPVPWCAGEPQLLGEDSPYFTQQPDAHILCKQCGLNTGVFETHDEAIAAWNTRQPQTDALKKAREIPAAALDALRNGQKQIDADGEMVGVSRRALDEVLAALKESK